MDEVQKLLAESNAPESVKQLAVKLTFEIAVPLAFQASGQSAGGDFLKLLIELITLLLPLILQILNPS